MWMVCKPDQVGHTTRGLHQLYTTHHPPHTIMCAVNEVHRVHVPPQRCNTICSRHIKPLDHVFVTMPCVVEPHVHIMPPDLITTLQLPLFAADAGEYIVSHVLVG